MLNFSHENLNSIVARDLDKTYIIEAFIKVNSMNIICSSETFDSAVLLDVEILYIHSILKSDHQSSTNRGGVSKCFKEYLLE